MASMNTTLPAQEVSYSTLNKYQPKIAGLVHNGGLIVIGETVVTLHKEMQKDKVWDTIGYGIPCLAANDDTLTISISSLENGDSLFEFNLTGPEKYRILDRHFHAFVSELDLGSHLSEQQAQSETYYGLSFAHEKVAERFYQAVMQLVPLASESLTSSEASKHTNSKRDRAQLMHILSKTLNVSTEEMTDFPPFESSSEYAKSKLSLEEAGALTSSGKFPTPLEDSTEDEQSFQVLQTSYNEATSEEDVIEDVDVDGRVSIRKRIKTVGKKSRLQLPSRMTIRRGSLEKITPDRKQFQLKKRSESLQDVRISYPTTVKHLAHVDQETPFHTLKQVVNTGSAPGSVFEESIDRKRFSKLHRTPSAPCRIRQRSKSLLKSFRPTILVTPAPAPRKKNLSPKFELPCPPQPIPDFESLLKQLQEPKEQPQASDDQSELTSSLDTWQLSFHSAVGNLIRKKLQSDTIYSKLLSLTQSGKQETCEKPNSRTTSVIIHDHGMVCL